MIKNIFNYIYIYWAQTYVFLCFNKIFHIIFHICYYSLLSYIFNCDKSIIYLIIQPNNLLFQEQIELLSNDISAYLQQDNMKQYFGSIDRKPQQVLISCYYQNYIIDIKNIENYLKTLNLDDMFYTYHHNREILKTFTLQYIEHCLSKEQEYYDALITPDYIANIKEELTEKLKTRYENSASFFIRMSPLITEDNLRLFLNKIDWVSYCKTEDCFSRRFELIMMYYSDYLIKNITVDYNKLLSYDIKTMFNIIKKHVTVEKDYVKMITSMFMLSLPTKYIEDILDNNTAAIVPGNNPIVGHIVTHNIAAIRAQRLAEIAEKERIAFILKVVASIYIEKEEDHWSITFGFFNFKIPFNKQN